MYLHNTFSMLQLLVVFRMLNKSSNFFPNSCVEDHEQEITRKDTRARINVRTLMQTCFLCLQQILTGNTVPFL